MKHDNGSSATRPGRVVRNAADVLQLVEDEIVREACLAVLVLWSWIWLAAGVLSVLNTTS